VFRFKFLPAWFEAPHDVMRHAFLNLGMPRGAELAAQAFAAAQLARQQAHAKHYPGMPFEKAPQPYLPPMSEVRPLESVFIQLLAALDDSE
jgi:hypothetical protein